MASPPTSPYCTTQDVHLLRFTQGDVSSTDMSDPWKTKASGLVDLIASQIGMYYASVGYIVPFDEYGSESWPDHQTSFLKFLNALGVASLFGSDAQEPGIADLGSRGNPKSWYQVQWDRFIQSIGAMRNGVRGESLAVLRADTRPGWPADKLLTDPRGILSDVVEGYPDPTRFDLLRQYTKRYRAYFVEKQGWFDPPSTDPYTVEWMSWWHSLMGYTYDSD